MPVPRGVRPIILLAAAAGGALAGTVLTACGSSPEQTVKQTLESAASWQATARMVAEQRRAGHVPEVYARQALRAGREELAKTRRKAAKSSGLPADARMALDQRLNQADSAVGRADTAAGAE